MQDLSRKELSMEKVNLSMQMVTFIRESSKTTIKTIKIARFSSDLEPGTMEELSMENIMEEEN